jgi:hypothetical protein
VSATQVRYAVDVAIAAQRALDNAEAAVRLGEANIVFQTFLESALYSIRELVALEIQARREGPAKDAAPTTPLNMRTFL